MGMNWKNIIKDQAHGMHPVTAFHKEERRMRDENRAAYEKRVKEQQERRKKQSGEHER